MRKFRLILCLCLLLALLSSTAQPVPAFEAMPPPAGADFSPFLMTCTLQLPLETAELTDRFGWRFHPIDGQLDFHYGLDLASDEGGTIRAVLAGTVQTAGFHESYGNYIILDHGNGFSTLYAHCSRLLVKEGKQVKAGQRIAKVGSTGAATGPHLHFEIIRNGVRLDPLWILGDGEELTSIPAPEE